MSPSSPFLIRGRDDHTVEGRAVRSSAAENYFVVPGCTITASGTRSLPVNTDVYSFWATASPILVDQMAVENTGAGSNVRIGIYRADRDWQPIGPPLVDSGDISVGTTGVKTFTPASPLLIRPGRYLSVANGSGSSPSYRTHRGYNPGITIPSSLSSNFGATVSVSRTHAAFPTPGTAWTTDTGASTNMDHFIVYRVSAA